MKDIIIIDSTLPFLYNPFEYLFEDLVPGNSSCNVILNKIKDISLEKIIFLPHGNNEKTNRIKDLCDKMKIKYWTVKTPVKNNADLYKNLKDFIKGRDIDNVILFYIDSPLIDVKMLMSLYDLHKKNLAEYTFGDNFVEGLTPEVMSGEFINKITEYQYKKPDVLSRKVFDCINADINKFFIELEIAQQDFSLMRIELTVSSARNFELIKRLLNLSGINDEYMAYYKAIKEHPEILFIFPKYVEIEITNDCNLSCVFCPRRKMKRKVEFMDFGLYKKIIHELIEKFDDIVLSFALMGEPLMHPQFLEFIDYALNQKKIFTLIVESNGVLLNKGIIKELSSYPVDKLVLLFGMDSLNQETYNKLRKSSDKNIFEKVKNNIIDFIDFNEHNKFRTFVQILKIKDNNLEIEDFYNFWQARGVNVVIQKYNRYLDVLEDRSVVDLTPLDRLPCWHIQRDLEIFSNGDIPVCKQDFNGETIAGNAGQSSMNEIWEKLKVYFLLNYKEKYEKMHICKNCDEWYTFNF